MLSPGLLARFLLSSIMVGLATALPAELPVQRVTVVRAYPHDTDAFTEGLFWHEGRLFESTGLNGKSSLREVRLADGERCCAGAICRPACSARGSSSGAGG